MPYFLHGLNCFECDCQKSVRILSNIGRVLSNEIKHYLGFMFDMQKIFIYSVLGLDTSGNKRMEFMAENLFFILKLHLKDVLWSHFKGRYSVTPE